MDFFDENISTSQAQDAGLGSFSYDDELAAFDEAYNPDDFSQADMNFATAMGRQTGGFGDDNTAQAIANYIAQPQVGLSRSNIRGMANYDPAFSAALDISRGLDPTHNFQGTGGLTVPSYLRPQIEGERGPLAPKYFSEGERFLQETLPKITENVGIVPFASKMFNSIVEPFKLGMDYVKNSTAGLSLKDIKDNLVQNVIASKYNPFTETGPYQEGDFPEGYNLVPEKRVEIGDKDLPIPTTYIDDLPQYLNTGIASIKPTAMAEARESMIDREQLIPPIFDYDYGYNDPKTKDLGYGIKTTDNKDELPLLKENVIDLRQEQYNKLADPLFVVNPGNFRPEVKNPYTFGSMGPEEFTFVNVGDA